MSPPCPVLSRVRVNQLIIHVLFLEIIPRSTLESSILAKDFRVADLLEQVGGRDTAWTNFGFPLSGQQDC